MKVKDLIERLNAVKNRYMPTEDEQYVFISALVYDADDTATYVDGAITYADHLPNGDVSIPVMDIHDAAAQEPGIPDMKFSCLMVDLSHLSPDAEVYFRLKSHDSRWASHGYQCPYYPVQNVRYRTENEIVLTTRLFEGKIETTK